ncbi:MAG TPA: chemotaxis response regulator protein-glutamate methylesterase [Steroidobacteraceae bacterium]|jgi:two-component system chemotaxis response regulator CheB|nr:chemotaxis response regulator protein-glutamate methylesterase [Steroidobacteraceae bacterium]
MSNKKIRVLVVDDSAVMRQLLSEILRTDPDIEVVGTAPDPYVAREKIKLLNPDVLTLDVEMPRMDGLAFLRNLMRLRPMPVVMCSSLTQNGAAVALDALSLGAVDFIAKPVVDVERGIREANQEIISKVKMAAQARVRTLSAVPPMVVADRHDASVVLPKRSAPRQFATTDKIIAIGASTGGTEAIKEVLAQLPADIPGVVIAQHIPQAFCGPFAARMNANSALSVCVASDGQPILAGHAYIAPGDRHLLVVRNGARYQCRLSDGELVNRHRPSVDVLFRSVAQSAGRNSIGVMLTGMGRDGAEGMKEMRDAGAATMAQDEATSVVWGMPGAAWQIGAAQSLHPLPQIAARILAMADAPLAALQRTN